VKQSDGRSVSCDGHSSELTCELTLCARLKTKITIFTRESSYCF